MIGSHQSTLPTPALCLNLPQWQKFLSATASQSRRHDKRWRPILCGSACGEMTQQVLAESEGFAAVSHVRELAPSIDSAISLPIRSLLVAQPPIDPRSVDLLLDLNAGFPVTVLCDHFIHAELISQAARERGQTVGLFIEVNPGRNRSGVRPGLDGRDLALGISKLPGVELKGLGADAGTILPNNPQSFRQVQSAIGILSELKEMLHREGIFCETISLALEGDLTQAIASDALTEIRTSTLPDPLSRDHEPILYLLATVFSRSKLERAVLDVGSSHLGLDAAPQRIEVLRTASHRSLPDVVVSAMEWDQTSLELGPASRDLIIGDVVEAVPQQGMIPLQLFSQLHTVNEKLVIGSWRIRS